MDPLAGEFRPELSGEFLHFLRLLLLHFGSFPDEAPVVDLDEAADGWEDV